jgi:hypothetical protein
LVDLLSGDVDLQSSEGEPAHHGEGLHGAQESAVSPIHPTLGVLGLGQRYPVFRFYIELPEIRAGALGVGSDARAGQAHQLRCRYMILQALLDAPFGAAHG